MSAPWGTHEAALLEDDARVLGAELVGVQPCQACGGDGGWMAEGHTCAPVGAPPLVPVRCPSCDGDGHQVCERCGERPAVARAGGEALCGECLGEVADNARHEAGPHASRCAWCRAWASEADRLRAEAGAVITHGICPACLRELERGTV